MGGYLSRAEIPRDERRRGVADAPAAPRDDASDAESCVDDEPLTMTFAYDTDDDVEHNWVNDDAMHYVANHTWLSHDGFWNGVAHMQWDAALFGLVEVSVLDAEKIEDPRPGEGPSLSREEREQLLGPHHRRCDKALDVCFDVTWGYVVATYGEDDDKFGGSRSGVCNSGVRAVRRLGDEFVLWRAVRFLSTFMSGVTDSMEVVFAATRGPYWGQAVSPVTSADMLYSIECYLQAQGLAREKFASPLHPRAPLLADDDSSVAADDVASVADSEADAQIARWDEEMMLEFRTASKFYGLGASDPETEGMSTGGWYDPDDDVGRWMHSPYGRTLKLRLAREMGIDDLDLDLARVQSVLCFWPVVAQLLWIEQFGRYKGGRTSAALHPFTNRALAIFAKAAELWTAHHMKSVFFFLSLRRRGTTLGPFDRVADETLEMILRYL